jgi:hypothetical protein
VAAEPAEALFPIGSWQDHGACDELLGLEGQEEYHLGAAGVRELGEQKIRSARSAAQGEVAFLDLPTFQMCGHLEAYSFLLIRRESRLGPARRIDHVPAAQKDAVRMHFSAPWTNEPLLEL